MSPEENTQVDDSAKVNIERNVESKTVKVRVVSETPLFKNGQLYQKGAELEMNQVTADNFVKIGEVEIVNAPEAQ